MHLRERAESEHQALQMEDMRNDDQQRRSRRDQYVVRIRMSEEIAMLTRVSQFFGAEPTRPQAYRDFTQRYQ